MVREAYRFALPPLVLALVLFLLHWNWAAVVFALLGFFVLYFFRDPNRIIPAELNVVVSPADGHVVEVVDEYLNGKPGRRISIFLSVMDVHVNRAPVAGRISKIEYRPGHFHAAWYAKASAENEQNVFSIETPAGEMVFKQIAGLIARRVVAWKSAGDTVALGERVGMIRFGSRVDVWLPSESEILVRRGQKVAGGSSVLAKWKSTI